MNLLRRLLIGFSLVLMSTGAVFAQSSDADNDIPSKLQKLAAELGCKTKIECRKIFDTNFARGVQLAEQHRVYTAEQQKLAKTFKESVLQKLSSVPEAEIERAIVDVARSILEKNRDLAKRLQLDEGRVRAAEEADGMKRFVRDLAAGKYPNLGKDPDAAGVICLRPSSPSVCDEVAATYFGPEGVAELARARSGIRDFADAYRSDTEKLELQLPDGRVLAGRDEIRRRCDEAFQSRDVAVAESCGRFAVSHRFAREDDVRRGLEFLRGVEGPGVDFRRCDVDPAACEQYLPEERRREFAAMRQLEDIMRKYIGFDPRECSRGDENPDVGQRCFEGSKKAISEIDALNLVTKSPEVARIVAEIKSRIREGEAYDRTREASQRAVRERGGPGGCNTEAACAAYCSVPEHGPECIAFGANVGVFRPSETRDRLHVQEVGRGGPTPECFRAIQDGDFVKAKEVCRVSPGFNDVVAPPNPVRPPCPTIAVRPETCANQPGTVPDVDEQCRVVCRPQPDICPRLPTVDTCPAGQVKRETYRSETCGVYYDCFPDPFAKKCLDGQYWFEASDGAGYCKPKTPQCDYAQQYLKVATNTCESKTRCSIFDDPEYHSSECRALRNDAGTLPPPIGDSCREYGSGWHRMEAETGNCYGPEMREFRVRSGVRYECGKQPAEILAPGCAPTPSPRQCLQGQYWNGATCVFSGTSVNSCDISLKNLLGDGCHYMYNDSVGNAVFCNGPMTMSAKRGDAATTSGCTPPSGGVGGGTPPAGQREQIWNILQLRSWVRVDADAARIESLKQSCLNTKPTHNVWMPGAGDFASPDFGMPDPAKCQAANACTSAESFDGTRCTTGGNVTPPQPVGQRQQEWNALGLRSWVRVDADAARIESLKQSCIRVATGANVWMPSAGDPTSFDFGMPDPAKCTLAASCTSEQYFDGSRCAVIGGTGGGGGVVPPTCASGQYWNGTACVASGGGTPPAGQREQIWNILLLRSWIRVDADAARIESLKQSCANTKPTHNVWMQSAGDSASSDFGMPDPAKCQAANACTSAESFDGTRCTTGGAWGGTSSCSADLTALLGSGCHPMAGGAYFNTEMTRWVIPPATVVSECASSYIAGCTTGSSGNQGQACPAGQSWNGTACVPIPTSSSSSCPADIAPLLGTGCHTMGNAWFDGSMVRYVLPNTTAVKECTVNYLSGCTVGSPQTRAYSSTPLANLLHVLFQLLR